MGSILALRFKTSYLGASDVVYEHHMNQPILAHFDGVHVVLDEPVSLEPNTRLLVTVAPKDDESEEWHALSAKRLEEAYSEDDEEYPLELVKESNPEYDAS